MDENWDLTMQRVCFLSQILTAEPNKALIQIVPHINGVNSVRIISILADTDFSLTCRAIRHLLYYGCLFLLDIFSFSAIYAPTAQFSATIASDEDMQRECARYVNATFASPTTASTNFDPDLSPRHNDPDAFWPPIGDPIPIDLTSADGSPRPVSPSTTSKSGSTAREDHRHLHPQTGTSTTTATTEDSSNVGGGGGGNTSSNVVDGVSIIELYASLKQGQSVKQWYIHHSRQLAHIDIRRFITFGVIKGFLYRVHKYAIATGMPAPSSKSSHLHHQHLHNYPTSGPSSRGPGTGTNSPYASSVGDDPAPIDQSTSAHSGSRPGTVVVVDDEDEEDFIDDKTLSKYLDGMHCFDQICTELEVSEKELTGRLKRYPGEVLILHR